MTPTCINPLPYCMHYVTCVKCIQEVFHSSLTFKAGSCHGAGSVVPGGTHNDNFRCRHWRRDWHRGSSGFSVFVHLFKRLFMFTPKVVGYRHTLCSIYLAVFTLQGIQKGCPMAPRKGGVWGVFLWALRLSRDVTSSLYVFSGIMS